MKRRFLALLAVCAAFRPAAAAAAEPAGARTVRVDYYHTGKGDAELFALDRVVVEPAPWPGNPKRPLDDTNLGEYFFEVVDRATNLPLYTRGFSTQFDVWEKTPAARGQYRTFEESLRFPLPERPVRVSVRRRDRANDFDEVWSFVLDPADPAIRRAAPRSPGRTVEIEKHGDPARKLDLLFLCDGYTARQRDDFVADARRLAAALFEHQPFGERRGDFNVRALCPEAADAGVTRPSAAVERDSPLHAEYDAFDVPHYLTSFDHHAVRAAASNAPYDALVVLANSEVYGGSGIFNGYAVVAAKSAWAPFLLAHHLAESLAGLAEENFGWDYPSPGGGMFWYSEPWQANITLEEDAATLKWRDLLTPGAELETPWKNDEYETLGREMRERLQKLRAERRPESEVDALLEEEKRRSTELLGTEHLHTVGVFEGAYHQESIYNRPQLDCVMFSRNDVDFCAVCRRELERVIALYSR